MFELIEKFLRYICGSFSCSCKSSCVDHCKHHDDKCNCWCRKKDDTQKQEIKSQSLKV